MRTFLASVILLCLFSGLYLLQGPEFFMPARDDPTFAVRLSGLSSRLLGAGLLLLAVLGVMASRQAGRSGGRAASRVWQMCFFFLTVAALVLITAALLSGTPGPNPEAQPPAGPVVAAAERREKVPPIGLNAAAW